MKKRKLGAMTGPDVLRFFEKFHYSRLPGREARRFFASVHYPLADLRHNLSQRIRLRMGGKT